MATRTGRRSLSWRDDKPATLIYVEALDGGDPANEVEFRDELFELEAPFDGDGNSIMKTTNRFAGVIWGDDNTAVAYDRWWDTRKMKAYVFNPSNQASKPVVIMDRNYQDRYSDPGDFVTKRNNLGRKF